MLQDIDEIESEDVINQAAIAPHGSVHTRKLTELSPDRN